MDFIRTAIREHCGSHLYRTAIDAEKYYNGENPTINKYEKILYDLQGKAHRDEWSANHKIASSFFRIVVDQEAGYLLSAGVMFRNDTTKDKLGKSFDRIVLDAAKKALIGGVSFGFWNVDHLDVFGIKEFVPLEDELTGALCAGIHFWQIAADRPMLITLYELDGYTSYVSDKGDMSVLETKQPYKLVYNVTEGAGSEFLYGENYPGFPIVPLNRTKERLSELTGKRNTIDALDLVTSNMVNNVDEGNLIYWVLTNCGGMDDLDDVKFIERLKTTHVAHADGDEGASVDAHTIDTPYVATDAAIDRLEKKLYKDFQAFDSSAVTASNQSATAIQASYVPLDLKADNFEPYVSEFIEGILKIAGIDDEPSYTRNRIINKMEETQTYLMGAQYVTSDYLTRKLLTVWGDADMVDEILKQQAEEDLGRFGGDVNADENEKEPESVG